jgi:hypothetical protein
MGVRRYPIVPLCTQRLHVHLHVREGYILLTFSSFGLSHACSIGHWQRAGATATSSTPKSRPLGALAHGGRLEIHLDPAAPAMAPMTMPTRPTAITSHAGTAAVAALGGDEDLLQLHRHARLDPADDPADEVLAAVIEALYPRLLGTPALLEVLRPQRNAGYLGAYYVLLGELSSQLPADDLPVVLAWASAHVRDGENAYGRLFPQLVGRGWAHAGSRATCEGLARLVASLACDPGWPHWPGRDTLAWAEADPEQRRRLAVGVAGTISPEQSYELLTLGLLVRNDLGWLLRDLPALPQPAQDALARCVPIWLDIPPQRKQMPFWR